MSFFFLLFFFFFLDIIRFEILWYILLDYCSLPSSQYKIQTYVPCSKRRSLQVKLIISSFFQSIKYSIQKLVGCHVKPPQNDVFLVLNTDRFGELRKFIP